LAEQFFHNNAGLPFIELDSIDSTNNYALQQIHACLAQHGVAYFAKEQFAGKGQRGKSWMADKGSNIILSVVINPQPLSVLQQFELSACAAVSVCEFFRKYAGDDARIKWPNDLYWQDRKAGGILIENVIGGMKNEVSRLTPLTINLKAEASWRWAVAGIGINVNQTTFPADLKNPVSLKQITGLHYSPLELAKELHQMIFFNFKELISSGFEKLYSNYISYLYKKNQLVKFRKGNRTFEATIRSVNREGKLVLKHAIEEEFSFGEIEWLISNGDTEK
jgi:BirA family biotin operon repressor/biotin-[acetyl-CoA-carboxylase] ligase